MTALLFPKCLSHQQLWGRIHPARDFSPAARPREELRNGLKPHMRPKVDSRLYP
jgi:hypothetical protein